MKRSVLFGSLLALALAGCSSLIPPVTVSDPLALNGKLVTLSASAAVASVGSQATQSGAISATFADISLSSLPLSPSKFSVCYDFTVTLNAPVSGTINLSNIKLNVSVNDGTNGPANLAATASSLTLSGTGSTVTASGKNLCGNIDNVGKMISVISQPPTPNTVTGTFSLDTDVPLPTGSSLTITFSNGQGTISL
ncbi:MAG: hypothetical protein IVW51_10825 [Thermaceae bacterium]|nr:hypothetical protein [Thermaceae bacterium]